MRKFVQNYLNRAGKSYKIDENIPTKLILFMLFSRILMLVRGIIKLRLKVFLGAKVTILNKKNIQFGRNVTIDKYTEIDAFSKEQVIFGNNSRIGAYSKLLSTSHLSTYGKGFKIGTDSGMGDYCHIGAAGGVEIGDDVIMGSYISFHSENHNFNDSSKLIREQGVNSKGIKLGNNIWVGAKVTFLDGAIVGDNSIVAAGAVVKGEFPENVIIGGVPAKIIKHLYI